MKKEIQLQDIIDVCTNGLYEEGDIAIKIKMFPKLAEELLALNHRNRNISRVLIRKYKKDFLEDKWKFTNAVILFTSERLLDGQHRLIAYLEACEERGAKNVNFITLIQLGFDESVFTVIDAGKGRKVADDNTIYGYSKYPYHFQETLQKIFKYEMRTWGTGGPKFDRESADTIRPRHADGAYESLHFVKGLMNRGNRNWMDKPDILAFFLYLSTFTPYENKTKQFVEKFLDMSYRGEGTDGWKGRGVCPIFEARYTWQSSLGEKRQNSHYFVVKLLTYALNLFITDMDIRSRHFEILYNEDANIDAEMLIPFREYGYFNSEMVA